MRLTALLGVVAIGWSSVGCDGGSESQPSGPPTTPTTVADTGPATTDAPPATPPPDTTPDTPPDTTPDTTPDTPPAPTTTAPDGPPIAPAGAPAHELLFSIPVGEGGVTYEGGGEEILLGGPSALTVAPDGSVWIADTPGLRLLRFSRDGKLLTAIYTDLDAVGPIVDVAAIDGGIWAWESVAALNRDRIVRYSDDGLLEEAHELPPHLELFTGLSGIWADDAGDPWVEIEGGGRVYRALRSDGEFAPEQADGYPALGLVVAFPPEDESGTQVGTARMFIGDAVVEAPIQQFGSFFFEGTARGAIALRFDDVSVGADGVFRVDSSVWWVSPTGEVLAKAVYPLADAAEVYVPTDFVEVALDGRLIAMVPRPDTLDIIELNAFAAS